MIAESRKRKAGILNALASGGDIAELMPTMEINLHVERSGAGFYYRYQPADEKLPQAIGQKELSDFVNITLPAKYPGYSLIINVVLTYFHMPAEGPAPRHILEYWTGYSIPTETDLQKRAEPLKAKHPGMHIVVKEVPESQIMEWDKYLNETY